MHYHEDEGWLKATFTQWIAPFIHHLQRVGYTTITVNDALRFKRFYTIRLYELMMQFQKTGERYIKIEELRKVFDISPKKYLKFSEFRRWVLDPSIKEIEKKTDWVIVWEAVRTGRRITSISFLFEKERQTDIFKAADRH